MPLAWEKSSDDGAEMVRQSLPIKLLQSFLRICYRIGGGLEYSFSATGGTGSMKDILSLLDAIHLPLLRPEYQPQPDSGVTHCNQYVNEVCTYYGYKSFDGLLANDMFDLIIKDPQWQETLMEKCQFLANQGSLVVAALKADPHGHINVICPGKEKDSGRWGMVPACANVGKEVFIGKGINWAFSVMPRFFAWKPSL